MRNWCPFFTFFCYKRVISVFLRINLLFSGGRGEICMKFFHHIAINVAASFAALSAFALVACDDSSSASNDEPVKSSSSVSEPGSSSVPESSSEKCDVKVEDCDALPATCDKEGAIETREDGNAKYGYSYKYYRCETGAWTERPASVLCDTAGVSKGGICRVQTNFAGFQFGKSSWTCYKYAGKGAWEETNCPAGPDKECNEENKGARELLTLTNDALFYKCMGEEWVEMSMEDYYCATGKEVVGDTCSFELSGKKYYFRYDSVDTDVGKWTEGTFDPELGFCTVRDDMYWKRPYAKKGEEYYYCAATAWLPTSLVPRQYTDPRKEGLTDEEYDKLDLPKDAKVGDRADGLLEYCDFNRDMGDLESHVYDFCYSVNHYRYREDGSWTKETLEDKHEDEVNLDSLPCGGSTWCCAETEGMTQRTFYAFDQPERLYQCVSGEVVLVEYLWNRYEKKDSAE